jgi:hypothetical protein
VGATSTLLPFFKNIKCKILLGHFSTGSYCLLCLYLAYQKQAYDLTVFFSAETFGAERRPIVEFALEDVEKVRLQKIWKERRDKSKGGEDQEGPSGDQSTSDGPRADKGRALRKRNKRKSHDGSSLPSGSGEGLAKDLSAAGGRSSRGGIRNERPAKRARKSNVGTMLAVRDGKDATKNTTAKVNAVLFKC